MQSPFFMTIFLFSNFPRIASIHLTNFSHFNLALRCPFFPQGGQRPNNYSENFAYAIRECSLILFLRCPQILYNGILPHFLCNNCYSFPSHTILTTSLSNYQTISAIQYSETGKFVNPSWHNEGRAMSPQFELSPLFFFLLHIIPISFLKKNKPRILFSIFFLLLLPFDISNYSRNYVISRWDNIVHPESVYVIFEHPLRI